MIFALLTFLNLTQPTAPTIVTEPNDPVIVQGAVGASTFKSNTLMYWVATNYTTTVIGKQWTFQTLNDTDKGILSATTSTPELADITPSGIVTYKAPGYAQFKLTMGNLTDDQRFGYTMSRQMTWTNAAYNTYTWLSNQPNTFSWYIWTNMIARTNGNTMDIWQTKAYSIATRSNYVRNPNCFMNGISNLTALSQLQDAIGNEPMAPPFTALTRRHAYTRGHGAGVETGTAAITNMECAGKNVVFVGAANEIVTMTCGERVTSNQSPGVYADFTIVIFTEDLPACITPMKALSQASLNLLQNIYYGPTIYPTYGYDPSDQYATVRNPYIPITSERDGHLSTSPGFYSSGQGFSYLGPNFAYPNFKAGDSGSPDMFLIGTDLAMGAGRTTAPASSPVIQQVIDQLSINAHLDPALYQIELVDLTSYPTYPP